MTTDTDEIITVAMSGDSVSSAPGPVIEIDLSRFQSGRWALQLDGVFAKRTQPVCVVSQGVAALAVAWWAQLSPRSYMKSIRGGIFLRPLSIGFGQDAIAAAARAGPITRLPFPTIATASSDLDVDRMRTLADGWGSYVLGISPGGSTRSASPIEAELIEILATMDALLPLYRPSPLGSSGFPKNVPSIG